MKRNISTTQFVIVICIFLMVIAVGAVWMFRKPAATESGGPPVAAGTPEATEAARQRGRDRNAEMRAEHGRDRQQPGGPGSQTTSPP